MAESKTNLREIYWSLFQTKEQIRVDGLRLEQVQSLVRSFSPTGIKPWFVWYEGIADWQPLDTLIVEISRLAVEQGFPEVIREASEKTITRTLNRDDRLIPRMQMTMKATVDYRGKLIQTETMDISLGGMKLKDALPFPSASSVLVTLKNDNAELAMKCRVVDPPGAAEKHRLLIETCHRMDILRRWITPKAS